MELSILELIIYCFVELFSLSMLIISVVKEVPNTRASSIVRSIYLIPGIIAAGIMAGSGQTITIGTINNVTRNINTTEVWTEATTQQINLVNPIWGMFHLMLFLVMMVFVAVQMFNLLTKSE